MIVKTPLRSFVLVLYASCVSKCNSTVSCTVDDDCEGILRRNSRCVNGQCTNPFYNEGCLKNYMRNWHKTRVCNSEDPPEAKEKGYCIDSPFDYMEVRISSQNWESSFVGTWILQIIFSEMLDVPTSVETSVAGMKLNFYDVDSPLNYGVSDDWKALQKGAEVGDCRKVKNREDDPYVSCSHVIPEVWKESLVDVSTLMDMGIIEAPTDLGTLAAQHWYIPKFTAERDPSLVSYFGLRGEENRRKLAERFLRPFTWKEYCDQISKTRCLFRDQVAERPPHEPTDDGSRYFVEGLYTGHFNATPRNDCDAFPNNCTGHIADWPCPWGSYVKPQTHYLNISLESNGGDTAGGYSYSQLAEIWAAANYTKSDVMLQWWFPDALYHDFQGTDAEFTRVALPEPTEECMANRITITDRCEATSLEQELGSAAGACDYSHQMLQKAIGKGLYNTTYNTKIPDALRSPAYATLQKFKITELQIGNMLEYWLKRGTDKWNFDLRDAACQWVVSSFDLVKSFVPATYPRVLMKEDTTGKALFDVATAVACLAIMMVFVSVILTCLKRKKKSIVLPQVKLLMTVLAGLFLISIGSFVSTEPPTNSTCISIAWLTNIGYILCLLPILLRIYAINLLASSGRQMQRAKLKERMLFFQMMLALSAISAFLILWTILDPPQKKIAYEQTEQTDSDGSTVVFFTEYCGSDSDLWMVISLSWQILLLLSAVMLAFMATRIQEDINDTHSFTKLILVLFVFTLMQGLFFLLSGDSVKEADMMGYASLIYSSESVLAVIIYFVPKLMDHGKDHNTKQPEPDLFPNATIMVATIDGFTAWASVREPCEVFKFLERIYTSLDDIAERLKIFKAESSAHNYVAATGIPLVRPDHAVLMAKFALECMFTMNDVTDKLDVVFGPDTSSLTLRIGIHSGPVTGGFLKGKGSRFQLFGDAVNMAGEMESSCIRGSIHISEATANLLIQAGKKKWVQKREERVVIKSKGAVETYWLDCMRTRKQKGNISDAASSSDDADDLWLISRTPSNTEKKNRLVEWNAEVFQRLLKQIVARRGSRRQTITPSEPTRGPDAASKIPLDEVKEIIHLPVFDRRAAKQQKSVDSITLPAVVVEELLDYLKTIASMYRDNPFHNFNHASHVVQSTIKHMNRIVQPSNLMSDESHSTSQVAALLHDHTYGITSDPLTQFACVFAALIHDVDHPGVPNPQLMKENEAMAARYKCRSIAEQNSFDLSWALLMEDRFQNLRGTICHDSSELLRFQQLVINSVMATDIGDKLLKELRNGRWDKAFNISKDFCESPIDAVNRKATIVIEHLIQAADVSHTMQHWDIYREWNERLFRELYVAWKAGRAEKSPAEFWYKGELGFYDFYIIPLAKKLSECGVFGVSSDENLNYAMRNREQWELEGGNVITEMLKQIHLEEDEIHVEEDEIHVEEDENHVEEDEIDSEDDGKIDSSQNQEAGRKQEGTELHGASTAGMQEERKDHIAALKDEGSLMLKGIHVEDNEQRTYNAVHSISQNQDIATKEDDTEESTGCMKENLEDNDIVVWNDEDCRSVK